MALAVVVVAVVALVVLAVVLLRQGDPGRLSEQAGRPSEGRHVQGRPAGPDAESMSPDPPGGSMSPEPPGER